MKPPSFSSSLALNLFEKMQLKWSWKADIDMMKILNPEDEKKREKTQI